jgi:hypothetical protein
MNPAHACDKQPSKKLSCIHIDEGGQLLLIQIK